MELSTLASIQPATMTWNHFAVRAFSTRDLYYVTSNIAYASAILVNQALVNRIIVRSV